MRMREIPRLRPGPAPRPQAAQASCFLKASLTEAAEGFQSPPESQPPHRCRRGPELAGRQGRRREPCCRTISSPLSAYALVRASGPQPMLSAATGPPRPKRPSLAEPWLVCLSPLGAFCDVQPVGYMHMWGYIGLELASHEDAGGRGSRVLAGRLGRQKQAMAT